MASPLGRFALPIALLLPPVAWMTFEMGLAATLRPACAAAGWLGPAWGGAAPQLAKHESAPDDARQREPRAAILQPRHERAGIDLGADRQKGADHRAGLEVKGRVGVIGDGKRGFDALPGGKRVAKRHNPSAQCQLVDRSNAHGPPPAWVADRS